MSFLSDMSRPYRPFMGGDDERAILASCEVSFTGDQAVPPCRTAIELDPPAGQIATDTRFSTEAPPSSVDLGPICAEGFDRPDPVLALRTPDS